MHEWLILRFGLLLLMFAVLLLIAFVAGRRREPPAAYENGRESQRNGTLALR